MMDSDIIYLARCLRLAVVQSQHRDGKLTENEARKLLSGQLKQDDPLSEFDDSSRLIAETFTVEESERKFDAISEEFRDESRMSSL